MSGWIGVDLDGTLAKYTGWLGAGVIGDPVPEMVERVKRWRSQGREVRIFTARIFPYTGVLLPENAMPVQEGKRWQDAFEAARAIAEWCKRHLGEVLPITCVKDYGMIELWDDRAVQVVPNTGRMVGQSTRGL